MAKVILKAGISYEKNAIAIPGPIEDRYGTLILAIPETYLHKLHDIQANFIGKKFWVTLSDDKPEDSGGESISGHDGNNPFGW